MTNARQPTPRFTFLRDWAALNSSELSWILLTSCLLLIGMVASFQ